jgi:hypothetical protein
MAMEDEGQANEILLATDGATSACPSGIFVVSAVRDTPVGIGHWTKPRSRLFEGI